MRPSPIIFLITIILLTISTTAVVYMNFNKNLPPIEVLLYDEDIIEVATANTLSCPQDLDNTNFEDNLDLVFDFDIVYVLDTSYMDDPDTTNIEDIVDMVNPLLAPGNMYLRPRNIDTLILNYVGGYYKGLLKYVQDTYADDAIVCVIVPEYALFNEEINGNIKVKGSALSLGANVFFVKENHAGNHTVTHEIGHVFGLKHIFSQPDYSVDGYSHETGDGICDTPKADGSMGVSRTCDAFPKNDTMYTQQELEILVTNTMSYSDPYCIRNFTRDQLNNIRNNVSLSPHMRRWLHNPNKDLKLTAEQLIYGEL